MTTTSTARRALATISGAALTLALLAACAESTADAPATSPEEEGTALVEDAQQYVGDPWEQRLKEQRQAESGSYVGDPWEQRLRSGTP